MTLVPLFCCHALFYCSIYIVTAQQWHILTYEIFIPLVSNSSTLWIHPYSAIMQQDVPELGNCHWRWHSQSHFFCSSHHRFITVNHPDRFKIRSSS